MRNNTSSGYITLAVLGGHMWVEWLHNPCPLEGPRWGDDNGQHQPLEKSPEARSLRVFLDQKQGVLKGECLPGARPARYLSINYPDFSLRCTL